MSLTGNAFIYYNLATLQADFATYQQILRDIAGGGQSYALPGRTFTIANLTEVKKTLADMGAAIAYLTGTQIVTATPIIDQAAASPYGYQDGEYWY